MVPHHAVRDVSGAEAEQITQLWRQTAAADSREVVEREQVKVFGQMSRKSVKLIPHPVDKTETCDAVLFSAASNNKCRKNTYSLAKRHVFKRFFMWFNCSLNACNRKSTFILNETIQITNKMCLHKS